jgi:hypothetical protein
MVYPKCHGLKSNSLHVYAQSRLGHRIEVEDDLTHALTDKVFVEYSMVTDRLPPSPTLGVSQNLAVGMI